MKKIITVLSLVLVSGSSFSQSPKDFDAGKNFAECMKNCRHHHREKLKMPRGSGKGMCFDICHTKHPNKK